MPICLWSTRFTAYLVVSPRSASMSYSSAGELMTTFLWSTTSTTSMSYPRWALGSMTRPVVVNGSMNILATGSEYAAGPHLSAMNTSIGSVGRSSNSISAAPGPWPLTLPEKASESRSWPAAYRCIFLASLAADMKAFQASSCISLLFSPFLWVIRSCMSSPHLVT